MQKRYFRSKRQIMNWI